MIDKMTELSKIKAFAFDVDGIFTDGNVIAMGDGELLRIFNAKDSFAVRTALGLGYPVAIITGGCANGLLHRFKTLGVADEHMYMLSCDKLPDLQHFCQQLSISMDEVLYAGDDIPDIPALKAAGIGICPCDAVEEVKAAADIVSEKAGGKLFVRNIIEQVLKAQNKWCTSPTLNWTCSYPKEINELAARHGRHAKKS
ncbi:MAG: HAD hydrolase family protein [Bacteroidales bacterium]|nr:HAD hydrolase family protein [Bacteroidales bacterium]